MYFEELLNKVSEPADVAVFLLGFVAGFVIDALFLVGDPPAGTIAGITATGFLGLKKGIDVSLAKSRWFGKKRSKRRLAILRQYFVDSKNPKAVEMIDGLVELLNSELIEYGRFEQLLDEKIQEYIEASLSSYGDLKSKYENLFNDFKELYSLTETPENNLEDIRNLRGKLSARYFPGEREMRRQRRYLPPAEIV